LSKKPVKKQSIKLLLLYMIVLPVSFSILAILIFQSINEYSRFSKESEIIREDYIKERKIRIKTEVNQGIAIIRSVIEYQKDFPGGIMSAFKDEEDALRKIQSRVVALLEQIESPDVGYLFGATWEGISIMGVAQGRNMYEVTDVNGLKIVQELIKAAKSGGGFVEYVMPEETGQRPALKISYAAPVPEWEWYIGAGVYVDEIETIIAQKLVQLNKKLLLDWAQSLGIIAIILVIAILIGRLFSHRLTENLSSFTDFLEKAAVHSLSLNPRSLHFSELQEIAHYANKMIDARIKSENALAESMEILKKVIDQMPVLLDAFDEHNRVIFWNRECERVTGYSSEEIMQHPDPFLLLYPDHEYRKKMLDVYQEQGFYLKGIEWEITTKQGEKRIISWTNISNNFEIPGWYTWAIGIDMTEKREMEQQLHQSEKLRAIGQLAGGVAHDFNNQLASILGYTEILDMRCVNELKKYTKSIIVAVNRASDLTQKLLAFARKGKFQSVYVNVNHIVKEVVDILKHSIDKRITIKTDLYGEVIGVWGDPAQIQNAILNIALNARDAMPTRGTIDFYTGIVNLDESYCSHSLYDIVPGTYVIIRISDTGTGMDKNVLTHIFEPFFTTKQIEKGRGMGLAAVYGTIKNHKGQITVESESGRGTVFSVFLPLARV
jgi:two-component system, cell cycle sensor histidine kinase and response regulator CckA